VSRCCHLDGIARHLNRLAKPEFGQDPPRREIPTRTRAVLNTSPDDRDAEQQRIAEKWSRDPIG
jgi:hypothetical protein